MAYEIERKFLLANEEWRGLAPGLEYRQGYLCCDKERAVRVRMAGNQAWLTVKGGNKGTRRSEFEYPIALDDAKEMLVTLCLPGIIEKIRHTIPWQGLVWEVDEFLGANLGLIVAEIELEHEDQEFARPHWIGAEVTNDPRYLNAMLAIKPYASWPARADSL